MDHGLVPLAHCVLPGVKSSVFTVAINNVFIHKLGFNEILRPGDSSSSLYYVLSAL